MKTARFVLKIVAGSLALASLACAVVGFWDVICELVRPVSDEDFDYLED